METKERTGEGLYREIWTYGRQEESGILYQVLEESTKSQDKVLRTSLLPPTDVMASVAWFLASTLAVFLLSLATALLLLRCCSLRRGRGQGAGRVLQAGSCPPSYKTVTRRELASLPSYSQACLLQPPTPTARLTASPVSIHTLVSTPRPTPPTHPHSSTNYINQYKF